MLSIVKEHVNIFSENRILTSYIFLLYNQGFDVKHNRIEIIAKDDGFDAISTSISGRISLLYFIIMHSITKNSGVLIYLKFLHN